MVVIINNCGTVKCYLTFKSFQLRATQKAEAVRGSNKGYSRGGITRSQGVLEELSASALSALVKPEKHRVTVVINTVTMVIKTVAMVINTVAMVIKTVAMVINTVAMVINTVAMVINTVAMVINTVAMVINTVAMVINIKHCYRGNNLGVVKATNLSLPW